MNSRLTGRAGALGWLSVGLALAALAIVGTTASAADTDNASSSRAHLVFVSNRDGDDDVYAVEASGARLSGLTRNNQGERLVVSPDGRRLAVLRYGARAWRVFLVSADGRRERRVPTGTAVLPTPEAFSPDGSRIALSFRRGRSNTYWDAVGVAAGSGPMQVVTPDNEDYRFAAWAPDGRSLLLLHKTYDERDNERRDLVIRSLTNGAMRPLVTDVAGGEAHWGATGRIAFWKGERRPEQLHLIDPTDPGSDTIIATSKNWIEIPSPDGRNRVGWSPNGRLLAYVVQNDDYSESLYLATPEATSGLLLRNLDSPTVAWSPRSDALAVETPMGLVVVGVNGRLRTRIKSSSNAVAASLSPDGTRLAFLREEGGVDDLWIANARTGRAKRLTRRGNVKIVRWAPGRVPAGAIRARAVPPTERSTARSLYAHARISEISASDSWVAAIVEGNARDCTHVVAWRPGKRSIVRFDRASCPWTEESYRLRLTGTHLTWIDYYCGNNCYTIGVAADLRRPGTSRVTSDERATARAPRHPAAPRETRRGVTMTLERGTIVLRRAGRSVRRIRPPGGAADAELEATGLFYAFGRANQSRVVFVPFARLGA